MEPHTEKQEALNAIDVVAAEVHAEYVRVGEQQGHKLPAWDKMPEEAKGMARTIARLMLSKMERVYMEARDNATKNFEEKLASLPKAQPGPAPVAPKSPEQVNALIESVTKQIKGVLMDWDAIKTGNPVEQGIDNAIRLFSERMAIEVLKESPELQAKLKESVAEMLTSGLLGDKEE